ncbi:nuclear pore complex protein Nup93-1-like [Contarinia nasturtii]|uniref:nuclear pore complex protein Nup93-1-like n=1 Tax=Contarinia nasturtii TaxID=265458 RepID=UPI0012D46B47|nr:nuclear pore complex protein Nup93-1-like [Contarinia nasturtii]
MDFNALLQEAQKLTNETNASDLLPRVERSLPQVLQATRELHSRVTQTEAQDIQAHILLGSKGIELPKISQKLESLSARKTFEPLEPISDTDVQGFLRNEKETAILSVIEEVHKNSYLSAQNQKWEHILSDWKQEKIKLMNALIGPSQNWIELVRKGPEQTVLNESIARGKSNLNNQEMAYACEVYEYNKLVIAGGLRPNLVEKFSKIATQFNDTKVNEIWEIITYMTNVTPLPKTQDPFKTRNTKFEFVAQAKKYLEYRYKLFMQTYIADRLPDAQRGGIPSVFNLVSSFVALNFNSQTGNTIGLEGHIDGKPLWPMVYYSLRCGNIQSALKCLQQAGLGHEDLVQVLEEKARKPNQRISAKLEAQIKMQYKRKIQNETDMYKCAVYGIIGCCDVPDHAKVAKTTDDFLWIQLSMIQPDDNGNMSNTDDLGSDSPTYSALQSMILEKYGEKYFNANEQPHLYFQVLALTGQFEPAIEFLSRFERYRTHAVHIALALNEMFLLGLPRNIQQPLLSIDIDDAAPLRRLNVARLIMLYVRNFEITDPAEALQYFYFLRNKRDPDGRNLFLTCVSDLAIECRDYDLLFGKMQRNGIRSRGLIDQFESIEIDVRKACEIVGDELVKKGLFEDAVKLYDLAGIEEQCLRYLSILLSPVVHQTGKKGSLRDRLYLKSLEFSERYADVLNCDSNIRATFFTLRDLVKFFDEYHEQKYQLALETLSQLKLVPLSMTDLELCVNNFKRLGGEVSKVFPDLLLATMDIIHTQYKSLKGRDGYAFNTDEAKERQLGILRDQAKAITNMAATVPYRMPGDISSRLVQTEILMH